MFQPTEDPPPFKRPPLGAVPKFRQQSCVAFVCALHEIPAAIGKLIEDGWWVEQISHSNLPHEGIKGVTVVAIVGKNADA